MSAIVRTTQAVPLSERAALSVREASAYTGIGRSRLYELLEEGKLRSAKIGSRRLVLRESCDKLLAEAVA